MTKVSRRLFLQVAGGATWATAAFGSYAFAVEPGFRLTLARYFLSPPGWPKGLVLRAVALADIHACRPWMPPERIRAMAELTNALQPDIIFLLGDFSGGHAIMTEPVMPEEWGEAISILKAPLGAFAVLGNHDWLHGPLPGMPSDDAKGVRDALVAANIRVLENQAVRLVKDGQGFWVAGLADQIAGPAGQGGVANLPATLAQIADAAPVVLLAHEPYIFRKTPKRVSLTLAGHTHGGQINIPYIQARYARVFDDLVYGHIVDDDRHLIISGGLGTSHLPVRFNRPPEIVEVTIGAPAPALGS